MPGTSQLVGERERADGRRGDSSRPERRQLGLPVAVRARVRVRGPACCLPQLPDLRRRGVQELPEHDVRSVPWDGVHRMWRMWHVWRAAPTVCTLRRVDLRALRGSSLPAGAVASPGRGSPVGRQRAPREGRRSADERFGPHAAIPEHQVEQPEPEQVAEPEARLRCRRRAFGRGCRSRTRNALRSDRTDRAAGSWDGAHRT